MAAAGMTTRVHAAAEANSLKARDLGPIFGVREAVAQPPDGLDEVDGKLLAQTPDEHLDRIGVPVEVLLVEMLDELGAGDDALAMHHQIMKHTIFVRGELDRLTLDRHARGLGVEDKRPALHFICLLYTSDAA